MSIERESYAAGKFIFLEGDKDAHFYIVQSGQVEIFTQTKDGAHHMAIATIGPGESFGEFAMLSNAPRSASARAVTDVELVRVSDEAYKHLIEQLPEWAGSMLRSFAARLRHMNEKIKDVPQFLPRL